VPAIPSARSARRCEKKQKSCCAPPRVGVHFGSFYLHSAAPKAGSFGTGNCHRFICAGGLSRRGCCIAGCARRVDVRACRVGGERRVRSVRRVDDERHAGGERRVLSSARRGQRRPPRPPRRRGRPRRAHNPRSARPPFGGAGPRRRRVRRIARLAALRIRAPRRSRARAVRPFRSLAPRSRHARRRAVALRATLGRPDRLRWPPPARPGCRNAHRTRPRRDHFEAQRSRGRSRCRGMDRCGPPPQCARAASRPPGRPCRIGHRTPPGISVRRIRFAGSPWRLRFRLRGIRRRF